MKLITFFLVLFCFIKQYDFKLLNDKNFEDHENSLNYSFKSTKKNELKYNKDSLLNQFIADPTVPVFLMMGLASFASILSQGMKTNLHLKSVDEISNEIYRSKRSTPAARWGDNILQILNKVAKAIEKYQTIENDIFTEYELNNLLAAKKQAIKNN